MAGDSRLLVLHERRGKDELLIWDVAADTETELELDLPGEVRADWYPDGKALLIVHTLPVADTLHRYDIAAGELSTVDTPAGHDRRRGRAAGRRRRVLLVLGRAPVRGARR